MTGAAGADQRALLREAIAAGADLVGGCPHLEGDELGAATDVLLGVAADFGVGVDLHTDETLDPTVDGLSELCRAVLAGFAHPATASHCVSLGQRPHVEQRAIAELVAEAGRRTSSHCPTRTCSSRVAARAPMPRGLTAVAALRAAGVNVAAGADNLQDPFNPVGRACPFETAGLMIMAAHLTPRGGLAGGLDGAGLRARSAAAGGRRGRTGAPDRRPSRHARARRSRSGPADRLRLAIRAADRRNPRVNSGASGRFAVTN